MPNFKNIKPSEGLDEESSTEWNRICAAANASGRKFKEADRALLETYVRTWKIWKECHARVQVEGSVITHHNGVLGTNPYYKNFHELTKLLRGLLADLGCTPASRDFDVKQKKEKPLALPKY